MNQIAKTLASQWLLELKPSDPTFAVAAVDRILQTARELAASDAHLQPTEQGVELRLRKDGVLHPAGVFPKEVGPSLVARLKVLGDLLTYRMDTPQEGRLRSSGSDVEMRLSTFPTLHGERAVIRLFARSGSFERLDELGLPEAVLEEVRRLLHETSGAMLVVGPAGSGKTTTAYACLRELVHDPLVCRSLMTMEDPIEMAVEGVAQAQVNDHVGLTLASGLRFILRQDPEVILVGEIRDRETAEAALQASLTGHLLVSTFHAGSAAEAVGRLSEMGIEPFLLRSGLLGILCQRLVRSLCGCARPGTSADDAQRLGLPVRDFRVPVGCSACKGTGYTGRFPLVEMLTVEQTELGRAILSRAESAVLEQAALNGGMVSRWRRALDAVEAGRTSAAEVRRVLGFGMPPS